MTCNVLNIVLLNVKPYSLTHSLTLLRGDAFGFLLLLLLLLLFAKFKLRLVISLSVQWSVSVYVCGGSTTSSIALPIFIIIFNTSASPRSSWSPTSPFPHP